MITKDMIFYGISADLILVKDLDGELVCQIGDYWFYFTKDYDNAIELWQNCDQHEITEMIYETLFDMHKDNINTLGSDNEYDYYEAYLEENLY